MDNNKCFIIFGDEEKDGVIVKLGDIKSDDLHIANLLEFAKEYYPDDIMLNKLNVRYQPEIAAFFIQAKGNIVFLNTTEYNQNSIARYGKSGILMLPDSITDKQADSLKEMFVDLKNYDLVIKNQLRLVDGFIESNTITCMEKIDIDTLNNILNRSKSIKH